MEPIRAVPDNENKHVWCIMGFARVRRWVVVAAIGMWVAACAGDPTPVYPPISFLDKTPLSFAVSSIEIVEEYTPPLKPPNVEHEFPVPPANVARAWIEQRLEAVGGLPTMRVIIEDASVVEAKLEKEGGLKGLFKDQQAKRYDAQLEVRFEIMEGGFRRAFADAVVKRSQTISESATLLEREQIFYDIAKSIGLDFDARMERNLRKYLGDYLL